MRQRTQNLCFCYISAFDYECKPGLILAEEKSPSLIPASIGSTQAECWLNPRLTPGLTWRNPASTLA